MESVLASSSAWKPKYKEVGDVDDTRTPECAESFMTLLTVITGNVTGDIVCTIQYKFYCQLPKGAFQRQILIVQVIKK